MSSNSWAAAFIAAGALYMIPTICAEPLEMAHVTLDEAKQLALLAAKSEIDRKLPGLSVQPTTGYRDPRFYVLEVRWNSPGPPEERSASMR